jgi:hypothetical protein
MSPGDCVAPPVPAMGIMERGSPVAIAWKALPRCVAPREAAQGRIGRWPIRQMRSSSRGPPLRAPPIPGDARSGPTREVRADGLLLLLLHPLGHRFPVLDLAKNFFSQSAFLASSGLGHRAPGRAEDEGRAYDQRDHRFHVLSPPLGVCEEHHPRHALAMRLRIHDADDVTTTEIADAARLAADPDRRASHCEHVLFWFPP